MSITTKPQMNHPSTHSLIQQPHPIQPSPSHQQGDLINQDRSLRSKHQDPAPAMPSKSQTRKRTQGKSTSIGVREGQLLGSSCSSVIYYIHTEDECKQISASMWWWLQWPSSWPDQTRPTLPCDTISSQSWRGTLRYIRMLWLRWLDIPHSCSCYFVPCV